MELKYSENFVRTHREQEFLRNLITTYEKANSIGSKNRRENSKDLEKELRNLLQEIDSLKRRLGKLEGERRKLENHRKKWIGI